MPREDVLVVFFSDHGESLGEHGYWGHGRHLYEFSLRIPLGFSWPGKIDPGVVTEPALIGDIGPTILGLTGVEPPDYVQGFDWSGVLLRGEAGPEGRVTLHQAHRGSVEAKEEQTRLRARGLLEVGRVAEGRKELYRVVNGRRRIFELGSDRRERRNLSEPGAEPSPELTAWVGGGQSGSHRGRRSAAAESHGRRSGRSESARVHRLIRVVHSRGRSSAWAARASAGCRPLAGGTGNASRCRG